MACRLPSVAATEQRNIIKQLVQRERWVLDGSGASRRKPFEGHIESTACHAHSYTARFKGSKSALSRASDSSHDNAGPRNHSALWLFGGCRGSHVQATWQIAGRGPADAGGLDDALYPR